MIYVVASIDMTQTIIYQGATTRNLLELLGPSQNNPEATHFVLDQSWLVKSGSRRYLSVVYLFAYLYYLLSQLWLSSASERSNNLR